MQNRKTRKNSQVFCYFHGKEMCLRMASLRDIAKQAGVSLSTVSRVINGYGNVQEQTRQRVLKVIHDLNYSYEYVPHQSRRNIMIGIIMPRTVGNSIMQHPNVHAVLTGIVSACNEEKVLNSLVMVDEESIRNQTLFDHMMNAYIILNADQREEDKVIPLLQEKGVPFVLINRWLEHRFISYVNVDDYGAMFDATLRMIQKGYHAIGLANGNISLRHSVYRQEGFLAACKQQGIPVRDEWLFHGSYDEENGHRIAIQIAEMNNRPTLMMTTSDIIARGLIKGFTECGIKVPQDIAVVGYGDVEMAAYFEPALTTVRMPAKEMGAEAVRSCMKMLNNPKIHHIKVAMDCELIERQTTGSLI